MITTNKQDRQGARTPADLERKYQLGVLDQRFAEVMGIATDARRQSIQATGIATEISERVDSLALTVKDLDENKLSELSVKVDEIDLLVKDLDADKLAELAVQIDEIYAVVKDLDAEEVAQLSIRVDGIAASVSKCATKEELDGYVTNETHAADLQITKEAITSEISEKYVTQATAEGFVTVETLDSKLTQTSESITASVSKSYVKLSDFGTDIESVTGEVVIGIINDESYAKISADRLDIYGKTLDIHVDATNIEGKLKAQQIDVTDLSALEATIGGWGMATDQLAAHGTSGGITEASGLKPGQIVSRRDEPELTRATAITSGEIEFYLDGEDIEQLRIATLYSNGQIYTIYVDPSSLALKVSVRNGYYIIPQVPKINASIDTSNIKISFAVEHRNMESGEVDSFNYIAAVGMSWIDFCNSIYNDGSFYLDSGGVLYNGDSLRLNGIAVDASKTIVDGGGYDTY